MRSSLRLLCGVLSALALVPGCNNQNAGKIKVAFVTNNPKEFWLFAEAGAAKGAEEAGVELSFRRPPNGTAAEQKEIIDALLAQGVKAIAISVINPENQTDYLNEIAERVPVLAVDNDADKSKRRCYIGTDNVKGGRQVGKLVREAMPDGGVVALFVGQIEPINARERVQGVLAELGIPLDGNKSADGKYRLHRKDPDSTDLAGIPYTDNVSDRVAEENAVAALAKLKKGNEKSVCLVGLWAYNPPALLRAVQGLEDKQWARGVRIVGFDEHLDTLKGIEDGLIHGTVVQNPYEFGHKSVKVMAALARGEKVDLPADGKDYIPERIVTRDGGAGRLKAAEFRVVVQKLLGK
jgi:ribose transport system substrate-binding protein